MPSGGTWSSFPITKTLPCPRIPRAAIISPRAPPAPTSFARTQPITRLSLKNSSSTVAPAVSEPHSWRDSWFTDDGVRVIYMLPRPWTDEILPLTLTPQPKELTRVMVGRAEVITTQVETHLFQLLSAAQAGDKQAQSQAISELKLL